MNTINIVINTLRSELNNKSDFEIRKDLTGFGLISASIALSYYKVDTNEYNNLYKNIYNLFNEFYKKASKDIIYFDCIVKYKSKTSRVFERQCTVQEKNIDEAIQRVKQKVYYNLDNDKKINNPIYVDIVVVNKQKS
jgi:hypothetical protein